MIDHGPGIRPGDRSQAFKPFQRLGDRDNTTGIGLGLALSLGFTEAMNGTLTMEETPGGGLTMVLSLPAAASELMSTPGAPSPLADPLQDQGQQRHDEPDPASGKEDPTDRGQEHPPR